MIHNKRQGGLWPWALLCAALAGPAVAAAQPPQDRVDYLIGTLLYAHDDDDREDAAEDLGRIGDPRAIPALEKAAAYDKDGGVRKEAYKALRWIRAAQPVVAAAPVASAPATQAAAAVVAPAPQPVAVAAPVYVAPPPVVVAPPPPVYVAPAPVVVPAYVYPAPVVVARPVCRPAFSFGFGFAFSRHHHGCHR